MSCKCEQKSPGVLLAGCAMALVGVCAAGYAVYWYLYLAQDRTDATDALFMLACGIILLKD